MTLFPSFRVFLLPLFLLAAGRPVLALEGGQWQAVCVMRMGNIDAIDDEDGALAVFLKSIRNDGRFVPPMRTLIGPEIRNATFFGLVYEAWVECAIMAPPTPGELEYLWVFPVEHRDEYMTHLAGQGLAEYEGMDGVTALREMDPDGSVRTWYLEWLPGNVAVFGARREAVSAARRTYAENRAARGLLSGAAGAYVEPDVLIRLFPARLAVWQDNEAGVYWWRNKITRLTGDLVSYWRPSSSRERLMRTLADELTAWVRNLRRLDIGVWFEPEGVEWRLTLEEDAAFPATRSQLEALRHLPERAALTYAVPITDASLSRFGERAGRLLLAAAGGAVAGESRTSARVLFEQLVQSRPRQAAIAWVPPPHGFPELGGSRMIVVELERPDALDEFWREVDGALAVGTPLTRTFGQLGWRVAIVESSVAAGAATVTISPIADEGGAPYYNAALALARQGRWLAVAVGPGHVDPGRTAAILAHRAELAEEAVSAAGEGGTDVRRVFTRVGPRGASFAGFLEPVRFMQLALIEAADWRPRSPDQHEPLSTALAREMLEYGSSDAWTFAGEKEGDGMLIVNGGIAWQSLSRLSAALGITEAISMD